MSAAEIITIILSFLALAGAGIGSAVRTSSKFAVMARDISDLIEDQKRLEAHNAKQHEELYNSRNDMAQAITRLSTLLEVMTAKQETMDAKLDILIGRGDRA